MTTRRELLDKLIEVDKITARLGGADRVICMSEILKDACREVGVAEEKIAVLGNRVSIRRFQPAPETDYDPQVVKALFVGRLETQKNIHGVARALALLKKDGWGVELHVCGGVRMNRYLRQALSVLDPPDWRYTAAVPNRELPARYHAVDMYAGPSFFEGFQIPLIEALACGKPSVCSDQPPASEIISAEVGVLVDPSDPAAIAGGIRQLKERLNSPDDRAKIRDACRRQAVRRWSYKAISDSEVELYLEVLALPNATTGPEKNAP